MRTKPLSYSADYRRTVPQSAHTSYLRVVESVDQIQRTLPVTASSPVGRCTRDRMQSAAADKLIDYNCDARTFPSISELGARR